MNTILSDRLFSDPRLRMLADRLKCPARALGLLGWIWHGTQNMGGVVLGADQILASIPLGTRRDRRWIVLLADCGWLAEQPGLSQSGEKLYRIVGNTDHVKARETFSENGKAGAAKRWGKKDGLAIPAAILETIASLPPDPPSLPPDPKRESVGGRALQDFASREFDSRGDSLGHLGSNHPEVQFLEAEYRERYGGPPLSKLERARAAEIIRRCAEAQTPWRDVMDFYARGFDFSGHTLEWLRDHLREVLNKLGHTGESRDDPEPNPTSPDWEAWFHRQQARKKKP